MINFSGATLRAEGSPQIEPLKFFNSQAEQNLIFRIVYIKKDKTQQNIGVPHLVLEAPKF